MPLDPSVTLQPHQQRIRDEAEQAAAAGTPYRKLLYWQVGAGKTTGSLGAADALGNAAVVAPAAVRPSFQLEAAKVLGQARYPVVSYQQAARRPEFAPETLVVDEAQRLGSEGSTQAHAVLDKAHAAKNLLLLSGTPVRNNPAEIAPLVSALTGERMSHDDFRDRFIGTESVRPGGIVGWLKGVPKVEQPALKNTDELKALLAGKVDYYENATPPAGAPNSVRHEDVEVELTPRQAQLYHGMMGRLDPVTRWKLRWNYPLSADELARTRSFMAGPRQLALSDYQWRPDGDAYKAFQNSAKLRAAMDRLKGRLADPRAKAIVYSNFPEAGLVPYAAALARERIPHAVFHGGLSDVERKQLVGDFNAGKIRTALVGPAGAEGISLKGSQLIQLLDNHWNQARMDQAQARGIRFDSHTGLPDDLRDVTVERYVAKLPLGVRDRVLAKLGLINPEPRQQSVDHYLKNLSDKKQRLNDQLLGLLREVADHNRGATKAAAARIHAGDALRLWKLTQQYPDIAKAAEERGPEAEYCPHCDARLERDPDAGTCNRCGKVWPAKEAASPLPADLGTLDQLRLAKAYSDMGTPEGYAVKTNILRNLITKDPMSWRIDSWLHGNFVGLTHVSNFRYHLPASQVSDLLPLLPGPQRANQSTGAAGVGVPPRSN